MAASWWWGASPSVGPKAAACCSTTLSYTLRSTKVPQRTAHGWFSWWICGIQTSQRLNGRPWISSLLQADENISHAGVSENGRGSAWAGCGTVSTHPHPRFHAQKPASTESSSLEFLYHVGSLFLLVIVSGKFSARSPLDFFFFPPSHLLLRFLSA